MTIVDRQLALRQVKLYGRVLDGTGRWVSGTPLNPWVLAGEHSGAPHMTTQSYPTFRVNRVAAPPESTGRDHQRGVRQRQPG